MVSESTLKDLLSRTELSQTDKVLVCLGVRAAKAKAVKDIKLIAVTHGLSKANKLNISLLLLRSKGLAVRTPKGWELTTDGKTHVRKVVAGFSGSVPQKYAKSLRDHLSDISDANVRGFIEETISAFESNLKRAAVVLSWIGAVSVLHQHVLKNNLADFNKEARKRNSKWKNAKTSDDLARMKESDLLDVLNAISVIGKNVKGELKICLGLRNGCGHPSSLKIGENRVAAHIEVLILNVFSVFTA